MAAFLLVLIACVCGSAARAAPMHCSEIPGSKMPGSEMPAVTIGHGQHGHGCCPAAHCTVDCPMHCSALIRFAPVSMAPAPPPKTAFMPAKPKLAAGWNPDPAHGPPRPPI